jgi:hypothetical protein
VHDLQILADVCSLQRILDDDFSAIFEGSDPFEIQEEFDLNECHTEMICWKKQHPHHLLHHHHHLVYHCHHLLIATPFLRAITTKNAITPPRAVTTDLCTCLIVVYRYLYGLCFYLFSYLQPKCPNLFCFCLLGRHYKN